MLVSLDQHGFPGYSIDENGNVWSNITNKWMSPSINYRGYLTICVHSGCTIRHPYIHQLVAMAFIPNPENKPQVNHIDGNKTNNHISNLEWSTNLENSKHARENGLMPHAVFTEEDVYLICQELTNGKSSTEISKTYGYPYDSVYQIRRGANWTHISSQFTFPPTRDRNTVLTEQQVREICVRLLNNDRVVDIAIDYHTSPDAIRKIKSGRSFRRITSEYF